MKERVHGHGQPEWCLKQLTKALDDGIGARFVHCRAGPAAEGVVAFGAWLSRLGGNIVHMAEANPARQEDVSLIRRSLVNRPRSRPRSRPRPRPRRRTRNSARIKSSIS